jgi:hypothetical protein
MLRDAEADAELQIIVIAFDGDFFAVHG